MNRRYQRVAHLMSYLTWVCLTCDANRAWRLLPELYHWQYTIDLGIR